MVDLKLLAPQNLWYLVGLIATDGNLSVDKRHINITSKDKDLLEGLKKILNLKNKLTRKARASEKMKKYFALQIGDVKFYNYLLGVGLMQRKSLVLGEINVPAPYFKDFLRGVVDGDGHISRWINNFNKNVQWSLRVTSAAPAFINWVKSNTEDTFKVSGKLYCYKYKGKKNPIYILKFGKLATKIILRSIYYRNSFCLKRKNKTAARCLKDKNKMVKYGNVIRLGAEIGRQP